MSQPFSSCFFFSFFPFWSQKAKRRVSTFFDSRRTGSYLVVDGSWCRKGKNGMSYVDLVLVTCAGPMCGFEPIVAPKMVRLKKKKKKSEGKKRESFFASIRNTQKPFDTQKDAHQNGAERLLLCCEMKTGAKTLQVIKVKGEEASSKRRLMASYSTVEYSLLACVYRWALLLLKGRSDERKESCQEHVNFRRFFFITFSRRRVMIHTKKYRDAPS